MRWIRLIMILILVLGLGACRKKGPTKQQEINALLDSGWEAIELDSWSEARIDFLDVLDFDPLIASANVGLGWSMILLGDDDLDGAAAYLEKGTTDTQWRYDAWSGLAAIRLSQGLYAKADSLAGLVLAAQPSYVFEKRPEIEWPDLLLIQAQARFITTDYAGAWLAIQPVIGGSPLPYGSVDPADPATWEIDGESYLLFEQALSVMISKLTDHYRAG